MTGANAAFTQAWISGTLRKLVVSLTSFAPHCSSRSHDGAVDTDVRAPEAVDRLLRVTDDEETAGHRPHLAPVGHVQDRRRQAAGAVRPAADRCPGTRRRRCRVKRSWNPRRTVASFAHEVARLQEQIEKVDAPARVFSSSYRSTAVRSSRCSAAARSASAVHAELIEVRARTGRRRRRPLARVVPCL